MSDSSKLMSCDTHTTLSQYTKGLFNVDACDANESGLAVGSNELFIVDVVVELGLTSIKW